MYRFCLRRYLKDQSFDWGKGLLYLNYPSKGLLYGDVDLYVKKSDETPNNLSSLFNQNGMNWLHIWNFYPESCIPDEYKVKGIK